MAEHQKLLHGQDAVPHSAGYLTLSTCETRRIILKAIREHEPDDAARTSIPANTFTTLKVHGWKCPAFSLRQTAVARNAANSIVPSSFHLSAQRKRKKVSRGFFGRLFRKNDDSEQDGEGDEEVNDMDDDMDVCIWDTDIEDSNSLPAITEREEDDQLDLFRAGQVPSIFLGRAYTNDALNGMGVHKMQHLVEDMFYSLIYEPTSLETINLLLKLCWLPRSRVQHVHRIYGNLAQAEHARGLQFVPSNHKPPETTGPDPASSSGPSVSFGTRHTPQEPRTALPEGVQVLMTSMLRISRMLLGLSVGSDPLHPTDTPSGDIGTNESSEGADSGLMGADSSRRGVDGTGAAAPSKRPHSNEDDSACVKHKGRWLEGSSTAALMAVLSDPAEAIPPALKDTAARLTAQWEGLARSLSPSQMPLGLAMLFCRVFPTDVYEFTSSPVDEHALQHYQRTPAGSSFRDAFEDMCSSSSLAPLPMSLDTSDDAPESMQLLSRDAMNTVVQNKGLGAMPIFYTPGIQLIMSVQGHVVQFRPFFMSRLQLVTCIKEVQNETVKLWLESRKTQREERGAAAAGLVAKIFSSEHHAAPSARRGSDDDGDEPAEVRELMDELAVDNMSAVIGPAPPKNGLAKSLELIAMGCVTCASSALSFASHAVDTTILNFPGGKRILGLHQEYAIHACRLHEYLQAAQQWNSQSVPIAVKQSEETRARMLIEIEAIMAALDEAVHNTRSELEASESDLSPQSSDKTDDTQNSELDNASFPPESHHRTGDDDPASDDTSVGNRADSTEALDATESATLSHSDILGAIESEIRQRTGEAASQWGPRSANDVTTSSDNSTAPDAEETTDNATESEAAAVAELCNDTSPSNSAEPHETIDDGSVAMSSDGEGEQDRVDSGSRAGTSVGGGNNDSLVSVRELELSREEYAIIHQLEHNHGAESLSSQLHMRMVEFLKSAMQERKSLLQNMVAVQQHRSITEADMRTLRSQERHSRIKVMRCLLKMGEDFTLLSDFDSIPALRTTWLNSVNSMLAMDSADNLSTLLDPSPTASKRIQRLQSVASDVEYMIQVGSAIWRHVTLNSSIMSHLFEPLSRHIQAAKHMKNTSQDSVSRAPPVDSRVATDASSLDGNPSMDNNTAMTKAGDNDDSDSVEVGNAVVRINLDLLQPVRSLGGGCSVALELDLMQLLGSVNHDMLRPCHAHDMVALHGHPEFRGLLLVGDLMNSAASGIKVESAPLHFGYLA